MKNRVIFVLFVLQISLCTWAQQPRQKFSPEKFDQELREYIIKEAELTTQEAEKFFAVYKEMREKQRALFGRQKNADRTKPASEEACMKAIKERDERELEQKRIQQEYHNKFLELLPASKVYDVLQAENRFHRHKLRQWGGGKVQKKRD